MTRLSTSSSRVVCAAAREGARRPPPRRRRPSRRRGCSGASGWIVGPPTAVATWTGRSSRSKAITSAASRRGGAASRPRPSRAPRRRSAPGRRPAIGRRGRGAARAVAVLHHRGVHRVLELAGEVARRCRPRRRPGAAAARGHVEPSDPGVRHRAAQEDGVRARPPAPRRRCSGPRRSGSGRPPCAARSGWFRTSWFLFPAASCGSPVQPRDTSGFRFGVQ